MTRNRKGQTAMEYLMTYGWAILIIIIVAAALFALGVFNPGTFTQSTSVGFSQFNVPTGSWQWLSTPDPDTFTIILANQAGSRIEVNNVVATAGTSSVCDSGALTTQLAPNQESTFTIICGVGVNLVQGTAYTASVTITYDNLDTGLNDFRSTGTVTGVVS